MRRPTGVDDLVKQKEGRAFYILSRIKSRQAVRADRARSRKACLDRCRATEFLCTCCHVDSVKPLRMMPALILGHSYGVDRSVAPAMTINYWSRRDSDFRTYLSAVLI